MVVVLMCEDVDDEFQMMGEFPEKAYNFQYRGRHACPMGPTDICGRVEGSSCKCQATAGLVDLTPISNTDGTPRWSNIPDIHGGPNLYSWNPCSPYTLISTDEDEGCKDVLGCQKIPYIPHVQYYPLATSDGVIFSTVRQVLHVEYEAQNRSMSVALICQDVADSLVMIWGGTPLHFKFEYTGIHACPGMTPFVEDELLSAGSILCIIFVSTVFLYLIGGVIYNAGVKKAKGKELMPNHEFWGEFPAYITEGTLFVIQCGRVRKGYDSV